MERRRDTQRIDLARRARRLAARYDLPASRSIRWSPNQLTLWGSCTPADGAIRISARLGAYPRWVLDYVIVHELAHLAYRSHGPRFAGLVDRYPLAERARGFLIAMGLEPADL
jgi:predicted metal-dependent hydrolase